MATLLPVRVKGCGGLLEPTTRIMVLYEDWNDKEIRKEGELRTFFNMDFKEFSCGQKWYSRREADNLLIICNSCVKRLGWKW